LRSPLRCASCVALSARAFETAHPRRAALVHSLVAACGLLAPQGPVVAVRAAPAPLDALREYHSAEYLQALGAPEAACEAALEAAGLSHDCPPFEGALAYACLVAGGSLAAADALLPPPLARARRKQHHRRARPRVAIHWDGGRHHARRAAASGFCYVNDVVLAMQRLQRNGASRILYVDIDVHHCDAVAEAFYRTDGALVVSMHMHGPGFFPGTGAGGERGAGRGAGHTLNLTLAPGLRDALFLEAFDALAGGAARVYRPNAVVLCCGADGLAGDPLGGWSLSPAALAGAASRAAAWGAPLLVLGGGGYSDANAARAWAAVTAALAHTGGDDAGSASAAGDIAAPGAPVPHHAHLLSYGPSFAMWDQAPLRRDENERRDVLARCAELLACLTAQYEEEEGDADVAGDDARRTDAAKHQDAPSDAAAAAAMAAAASMAAATAQTVVGVAAA
jgi:acetoin utilization deacetylase AcuC-like enzyme